MSKIVQTILQENTNTVQAPDAWSKLRKQSWARLLQKVYLSAAKHARSFKDLEFSDIFMDEYYKRPEYPGTILLYW